MAALVWGPLLRKTGRSDISDRFLSGGAAPESQSNAAAVFSVGAINFSVALLVDAASHLRAARERHNERGERGQRGAPVSSRQHK